jgi:hypothetical protein
MASAELLKMTYSIDGKVMRVDDRVRYVEGKVEDVRDDVQGVCNKVQDVRVDVRDIRDKVQDVHVDVQDICDKVQDARVNVQVVGDKIQDVDDRVQDIGKDISLRVQAVDDKLDHANRSSYSPLHESDRSKNFTGNRLRDDLLRWLSPPDSSTNHNIAYKAHHDGTAEWFFRGSTFSQWKSNGSFLWIHGKRVLNMVFTLPQPLIVCFCSGVWEKCPLVRLSFDSFHPCDIDIIISVPRSYKIHWLCAMLGRPQ